MAVGSTMKVAVALAPLEEEGRCAQAESGRAEEDGRTSGRGRGAEDDGHSQRGRQTEGDARKTKLKPTINVARCAYVDENDEVGQIKRLL